MQVPNLYQQPQTCTDVTRNGTDKKWLCIPLLLPLLFLSACAQPLSILTAKHDPHQAWTAPFDGLVNGQVVAANGMVYLNTNKLFAWDAASGHLKWTAPIAGYPQTGDGLVVVNGMAYIIGSSSAPGGLSLFALDASSGQQKWTAPASSFILANGMVYISNNNLGNMSGMSAFDATSGQKKWTILGINASYVTNGLLYTAGKTLSAWDAASGQQKWTASSGGSIVATANGLLYLESNDPIQGTHISALDAASGQQKWTAHFDSSPENDVLDNGVLYVGPFGGADNQTMSALDAASGQQKWTVALGNGFHLGLAIANDMLYFGEDREYAFDATNGQQKWAVAPGGFYNPQRTANFSSPTIANGAVYIVSYLDEGNLYVLDAATGQQTGIVPANGANVQTVSVANGMAYVIGPHKLYAFSL